MRVIRSASIPEQEDDAVCAAVEGVGGLLPGHVASHVQRRLPERVPGGMEHGRKADGRWLARSSFDSFGFRFSAILQSGLGRFRPTPKIRDETLQQ